MASETLPDAGRLPELIDYPAGWPKLDDLMSNFDHEINQSVAEELKTVQATADYPGWEFFATCWWDGARGVLGRLVTFERLHAEHANG